MAKAKLDFFIEKMFWIQGQVQLVHWLQKNGFRHEVLGEFYKKINKKIDSLVESYAGVFGDEALYINENDFLFKIDNDLSLEDLMHRITTIFSELRIIFEEQTIYGLVNEIDDILSLIIHTNYLLGRE